MAETFLVGNPDRKDLSKKHEKKFNLFRNRRISLFGGFVSFVDMI